MRALKMLRLFPLLAVLLPGIAFAQFDDAPPPPPAAYALPSIGSQNVTGQGIYGMVGFYNPTTYITDNGLFFFTSDDGKRWSVASRLPFYTAGSGHTRDPSVLYYNNAFYIAYTNGTGNANGTTFTIIKSPDFAIDPNDTSWTLVANVDASACNSGAISTWAPEWFVDSDGSVNITVSRGNGTADTGFVGCLLTATDSTLANYSAAVQLTGSGTGWSSDQIDGKMLLIGGVYYYVYKDESVGQKYIVYASGSSKTGPFVQQATGNWAGWGQNIEAPTFIQKNASTIRIYFDNYLAATGIGYSESSNWPASGASATWTAPVLISGAGGPLNSPSVFRMQDINAMRNFLVAAAPVDPMGLTAQFGSNCAPLQTLNTGDTVIVCNSGVSAFRVESHSNGGASASYRMVNQGTQYADIGIAGHANAYMFTSQNVPWTLGINNVQTGVLGTDKSLAYQHFGGFGTAPGVAADVGAGTGPTIALSNAHDAAFDISVTTGLAPAASAVIATVTFNVAYGNTPHCKFSPTNANASALSGNSSVFETTTTGTWVLNSGSTNLTASTVYSWSVACTQ